MPETSIKKAVVFNSPWSRLKSMKHRGLYVAFLVTVMASASSSNIPEKNPFRSTQLKSLSQSNAPTLKIYFSGNVTGMRESCGCALSPKGGLERRYNFLKKEGILKGHSDDTLVVDFGNMLFKTSEFQSGSGEKEALANAQKMIEGSNLFNFTAVNFGFLDRALAPEKLSKLWAASRFPWLATNVVPGGRYGGRFSKRISLKLKSGNAVIFGLSSMGPNIKPFGWGFTPPAQALMQELADLPADTFPIVLSDVEMSELLPMASQVKRPILFLGSRETGGWDRPIEMNRALLLHLRQQGQDWGMMKFSPHQKNKVGWYDPGDTESLAKRWDDLIAEAKAIRSLAQSEQRDFEMESLELKLKELAKLAPQSDDFVYSFETTEMNATYDGKNEVSNFMK